MEYALQLLSAVVALGATGYAELTATAIASSVAAYKTFCAGELHTRAFEHPANTG